jgi:restriction endonuclease S subunit
MAEPPMPEDNAIATILEALLEQTRAIRDVKIQVESLKQMMFEHRPAFVPTFEERLKKVSDSGELEQLDSLIARLEASVRELRG